MTMSATLQLTIVYEDAGDGWIMASIPQVPGTRSQGRTREQARENVIDALRVMLAGDDRELVADATASTEPLELTIGS